MDDITANRTIDFVYDALIERGVFPSVADAAGHFRTDTATIARVVRESRVGKTLLLDSNDALWMAGPFSARPTSYRVSAGTKSWWANCAWDALGVAAIVDSSVEISTSCPDCGEELAFHLERKSDDVPAWPVHFLVPASRWYDDIGFT